MKNFIRKLPVKIICFILCGIFLCITVAGVVGAVLIAFEGFYKETEEELFWDEYHYDVFYKANMFTYSAVSGKAYHYETDYSADKTNLRYAVFDGSGNAVLTNCGGNGDWVYHFKFERYLNGERWDVRNIDPGYNTDIADENIWTCSVYFEEGFPVSDEYAFTAGIIEIGYSLRYTVYVIVAVSFALFITLIIVLMCASARRPNSDELHPGYLNRVPFDIILAAVGALAIVFAAMVDGAEYDTYALALTVTVIAAACALIGLCMSIAARIKQHNLFKNTVIRRVCDLIWKVLKFIGKGFVTVFRALPMIWRTALVLAANSLIDFLSLVLVSNNDEEAAVFLYFFKLIVIMCAGLYAAIFMRRLQKGAQALADGDLAYHTDTSGMFWDFKKHGENLNSISAGMAVAVEERLQSERMKAELITNVSHDIKTPLTSIINYAGLISDEKCDCVHHGEYSEVLVRKSERLRHLLDDLVEISKANTGNLDVTLLPCDAGVLLAQASGEYQQKCENAGLELIADIPEEGVKIMADSRRIWRVFANLLNNAVKYSLPGSRVYISLVKTGNEAWFVFRNTSRSALNITPEELTERFVRGDSSRTTEGNGLGLSIAKSLTELQNGKMDISIDGDLFKVTLSFPVI